MLILALFKGSTDNFIEICCISSFNLINCNVFNARDIENKPNNEPLSRNFMSFIQLLLVF